MEIVPFGESVHYRKLQSDDKNKLESPWEDGVWLGHERGSNEYLIGTDKGVVRAWAVKRRPESERWSAAAIKNMQGTPARPDPNQPGNSIPIHIILPDADGPVPEPEPRVETNARKTYLKKRDFEKHGYTDGCEGCRRLRTGGMEARPHNSQCRTRMEELLKNEDNPRWKNAQARMNEKVWEHIKQNDPEAAAAEETAAAEEQGTTATPMDETNNPKTEEAKDAAGGAEERKGGGEAGSSTSRGGEKRPAEEDDHTNEPKWTQEEKKVKIQPAQGHKRELGDANTGEAEERPPTRMRIEDNPMYTDITEGMLHIDVAEVYSQPRVMAQVRRFQLRPGEAMDITTGWDFRRKEDRQRAEQYVTDQKPCC